MEHIRCVYCFILIFHWTLVSVCKGQAGYKYNCSETYYPESSLIHVAGYEHAQTCKWEFKVHYGQTVQLTFLDYSIGTCYKRPNYYPNYVQVIDGNEEQPKMCVSREFAAQYTSRNETVTVIFSTDGNFDDSVIIVVTMKTTQKPIYTVNNKPVTWEQAWDTCKQNGGYLATTYPVVPKTIHTLISGPLSNWWADLLDLDRAKRKLTKLLTDVTTYVGFPTNIVKNETISQLWIGKSVTYWVWHRGCVRLDIRERDELRYTDSKYNQMSECATVCRQYPSFLVQDRTCYCMSERNIAESDYVPLSMCDYYCPGSDDERCGGKNTFTMYQFFTGDLDVKGMYMNQHCVVETRHIYKTEECDTLHGFTCRFRNDTYVTYSSTIIPDLKSLPWRQAVNFCAGLSGSLGLAPTPRRHNPYFGETYWTGLFRVIIGDYPTVSSYKPEYTFVTGIEYDFYMEQLIAPGRKRRFICQRDPVTCGEAQDGESGNFTSPGFPNNYEPQIHCEWSVNVSIGRVIQFRFHTLDMEENEGCLYDYIRIIDSSGPILLCNRADRPVTLTTASNNVTVVFKSDDTVTGKGFSLTWKAVTPVTGITESRTRRTKLSGGAIAGITIAVTVLLLVLIAFILCFVYRKRLIKQQKIKTESSMANNAMYGISSFADDSEFSAGTAAYENSGANGKDFQRNASYANHPSKIVEDSKNEYEDIIDSVGNTKPLSSTSNTKCAKDSRVKRPTKTASENTAVDTKKLTVGGQETLTMRELNNLGKDAIKVEPEGASPMHGFDSSGHGSCAAAVTGSSVARTDVESKTDVPGYINSPDGGLQYHAYLELQNSVASVTSSLHYEDMDSVSRDPSIRMARDNVYTEVVHK